MRGNIKEESVDSTAAIFVLGLILIVLSVGSVLIFYMYDKNYDTLMRLCEDMVDDLEVLHARNQYLEERNKERLTRMLSENQENPQHFRPMFDSQGAVFIYPESEEEVQDMVHRTTYVETISPPVEFTVLDGGDDEREDCGHSGEESPEESTSGVLRSGDV